MNNEYENKVIINYNIQTWNLYNYLHFLQFVKFYQSINTITQASTIQSTTQSIKSETQIKTKIFFGRPLQNELELWRPPLLTFPQNIVAANGKQNRIPRANRCQCGPFSPPPKHAHDCGAMLKAWVDAVAAGRQWCLNHRARTISRRRHPPPPACLRRGGAKRTTHDAAAFVLGMHINGT